MRPQTITEKIFSSSAKKDVYASDIVEVNVDMTIGNDITTPISIKEFENSQASKLANPDGFSIVLDHFIPAKDIASANQAKISREFAKKHNLKNFFDEKNMGIEHAILPESGLVVPGDIIIGADSHTCTHGALGAFATGMGSTDIAFAMITGKNWFKVPYSIEVVLSGKPADRIYGKDIILELIRQLGVSGALYGALEFVGDGVQYLGMDDRFSLCNMAIEAGAKNGIVRVDDITKQYLSDKNLARQPKFLYSDEGANYAKRIEIDLSTLEPMVAYPFLPSNGKKISEAIKDDISVDQVFIGSCTNGRLSDLIIAADILRGKKVAQNTRLIITPATNKIAQTAQHMGLYDVFYESGALVSNPTCGACLGGYMGILGENERCISTSNRNFVGRMGHRSSEVYLASSATAAASAVMGVITDPREFNT